MIQPPEIPVPPKKRSHHAFALILMAGNSLTDAYLKAGYHCTRPAAAVAGHRLNKRKDIRQFIEASQRIRAAENLSRFLGHYPQR